MGFRRPGAWSGCRVGVGDGGEIAGDDGGAEAVPGQPVHATLDRRIRDLVMLIRTYQSIGMRN
jgi:hypothetical protein